MERGPVTLFGAIIAVGLGPAMWLGAQFGNVADLPTSPPGVRSVQTPQNHNKGGAAGAAPEDPTVVLETKPRTDKGRDGIPRSQPPASATTITRPRQPGPSVTPSPSDETSTPAPEAPASAPGIETGGGDGGSDESIQPSPPTDPGPGTSGDPQQPARAS